MTLGLIEMTHWIIFTGAGLDLDGYRFSVERHDQVKFTTADAGIAVENPRTTPFEESRRDRFA